MSSIVRFIVAVNDKPQNFLSIKETPQQDLIVSLRGKRHSVSIDENLSFSRDSDPSRATTSSITIHPNLKSQIGSVTVHYKDQTGGDLPVKTPGGALGVRLGDRWLPIVTSIGRNIGRSGLTLKTSSGNDRLVELWPGAGIDLTKDSLAFTLFVANRDIDYLVPDDYPGNVEKIVFGQLQVALHYWLFNQPTRFRGTTLTHPVTGDYPKGLEFHEVLNFTQVVTMAHLARFDQAQLHATLVGPGNHRLATELFAVVATNHLRKAPGPARGNAQ